MKGRAARDEKRGRPLDLRSAATMSPAEVMAALECGAAGLDSIEVARRRIEYGRNVLVTRNVTALGVFLRQLRNPLLILLLGAALVSAFTGDRTDALIIAAIVALSLGLGFVNEYRSEVAVAALHDNIRHETVVRRDGNAQRVDVRDLVPGDLVELHIGDLVPADLRLVTVNQLECDEAVLTGESVPAEKLVGAVAQANGVDLASCAFMGTLVKHGSATAMVVATGSATAFGKIAVGLTERVAETAFQVGLRGFSRMLVRVATVLTVSIFVANAALSRPLIDALLFSLAIAIGITPQLLPAIVSVSLSTGSRQLARRGVLIKRLVVIEDLGNVSVLFTDKTGTLTEGSVTFERAIDAAGRESRDTFVLGLVCNEATLTPAGPVGGNTLDIALWLSPLAPDVAGPTGVAGFARLGLLPFDHDRQLASVLVGREDGTRLVVTKGAPEAVLARCTGVPDSARATLDALFADGSRVIAVAQRRVSPDAALDPTLEANLDFVGYLVLVDPLRADAAASIGQLGQLGITVKIITGDNGIVAARVCRDLGVPVDGTLSGAEIEALSDDDLQTAIRTTTIYARVTPDQKSRIVRIARREGVDVAFMGDGVNDAVALHAADVGISVASATDIAKDAADVVLLAKDLGVLAEGVMEGRRIFSNTMKYVLMATSSNFGNMFSAAGASVFLSFLPMLPSQILLNNLLYDVGQLAIPTDNVDPEVLVRPAAWDISFVRKFMMVFGPVSSIFDFLTFFVMLVVLNASHQEFRSGWFVESLATQTLVVFIIRTRRVPFFRSRPSPAMIVIPVACAVVGALLPLLPLNTTLGFASLPLRFFLILFAMIITYLLLVEFTKTRFYAAQRRLVPTPSTHAQRLEHRIRRRAFRFVHHAVEGKPPRT